MKLIFVNKDTCAPTYLGLESFNDSIDTRRGGGGVLPGILGGGLPPGSSNPDPISDLDMPFSRPVFRPDL